MQELLKTTCLHQLHALVPLIAHEQRLQISSLLLDPLFAVHLLLAHHEPAWWMTNHASDTGAW